MLPNFLKLLWSQKYNLLVKIGDKIYPCILIEGLLCIMFYEVWNPPVVNAHMFSSGMKLHVLSTLSDLQISNFYCLQKKMTFIAFFLYVVA